MSKSAHQTARESIMQEFVTAWNASAFGPTNDNEPIGYENMPFEQPETGRFFKLYLLPGNTEPAAIGPAKLNRTPFALMLQCFIPEREGSIKAWEAADIMAELDYKTGYATHIASDTRIHYKFRTAGSVQSIGKDGPWAQFNVSILGVYDAEPGTSVAP